MDRIYFTFEICQCNPRLVLIDEIANIHNHLLTMIIMMMIILIKYYDNNYYNNGWYITKDIIASSDDSAIKQLQFSQCTFKEMITIAN